MTAEPRGPVAAAVAPPEPDVAAALLREAGAPDGQVAAASARTAAALADVEVVARTDDGLVDATTGRWTQHPAHSPEGPHAAVVLLTDDLADAGAHVDTLLAAAAAQLRAGGRLLVSARSRLGHPPQAAAAAFDSAHLTRAVGHTGLAIVDRLAPGAAARLAAQPPALDLAADRAPGLLDAGATVVCVGERTDNPTARTQAFFATVPRKVVAAAVLCRDEQGRLLCVHDRFKGRWTIPGGVVDADENPDDGARREAREESGLDVEVGELLGVFGASWPDRLTLVFAATPGPPVRDGPLHHHEIDDVAWWPPEQALERLAPYIAEQVRRCLTRPGGVWRQPMA